MEKKFNVRKDSTAKVSGCAKYLEILQPLSHCNKGKEHNHQVELRQRKVETGILIGEVMTLGRQQTTIYRQISKYMYITSSN